MSTSIMIKNNNIFKDKTAKDKTVFTQIIRKKIKSIIIIKRQVLICQ